MKILAKAAVFAAIVTSTSAFSSTYVQLGKEASDAIYHLSKYCAVELGELKQAYPSAWIGSAGKWYNQNSNYGYNFEVLYAPNYFSTEQLATLSLSARYIPNPPADASNYEYSCTVNYN
ncbi:hypothetical protein H0A36_13575 [Endozoicomonas sp. SM1973]|uniref:Uncharacterized protein n=1 Tax=Spartinivicinus marinus TaxID=2994442 RepID=A0A853ICY6_9GAMM|nr:hypothetical protein [Spartinivicinus marinus]MCX4027049.1 hypothetical protein [Spartinivicinus marinus]NYZ67045.1 hypothetical protein [Spartinivicinus marinus]